MIPDAHATVIRGHGLLMIQGLSETVAGVWISSRPWERLPDTASDEELGASVRRVLEGSVRGVPNPPKDMSMAEHARPFVKAMGFRSNRELMRGSVIVMVAEEDGRVRALPTRGGQFTGSEVRSASLDPALIGIAVRQAIRQSSPS